MLETMLIWLKTLPAWLMHLAEVLIIAIIFMTAMTFLVGIWCGLRIVGARAKSIKEISIIPPKIVFNEPEDYANK